MSDRAEERRNPDRIARSRATISAGIDALERVKFAKDPLSRKSRWPAPWAISISACRTLMEEFHPNLSAWYARFCDYPAMKATAPK